MKDDQNMILPSASYEEIKSDKRAKKGYNVNWH